MDPTSNISEYTLYFTTFFILDFQEHVLIKSLKHTFAGARKVHSPDFSKDMLLKFKIKNVVNYDVCLVILLVTSM